MAVLLLTPSVPTPADVLRVSVRGPVDPAAVDALRETLLHPAGPAAVALDHSEVTEFPQRAVAVLVSARRALGERLRIRGNPQVLALVEDAGLGHVLPLLP
jgi:anti-anti-sigma regulatory factor